MWLFFSRWHCFCINLSVGWFEYSHTNTHKFTLIATTLSCFKTVAGLCCVCVLILMLCHVFTYVESFLRTHAVSQVKISINKAKHTRTNGHKKRFFFHPPLMITRSEAIHQNQPTNQPISNPGLRKPKTKENTKTTTTQERKIKNKLKEGAKK